VNATRRERMGNTWERVKTEPGLARNTFITLGLIVLAFVVGGILLSQQRFIAPWQDRYVLYATFTGAPGVSPGQGQEVRIAGVQVGQIVAADIDDSGSARLELSMDESVRDKVYDNAHLVLRPKSPLNEMYVIMEPGGPPGQVLHSGGTLPVSAAERPVQIDEVLGNLDAHSREMLTALLSESDVALVNAQKTLPPGLDAIRLVSNDLKPVSQELAKRKEKLRTLVTALGQIAQGVGHDDNRLRSLGDGLQSTLGTLSANDKEFESSLNQLPDLLKQLHRATDSVQGLADQLDPTLRNLEQASDQLPDALKALEGTSDKLDDTVDAAKGFVAEARPAVDDLRPFAAQARGGTPGLADATGRLDTITGRVLDFSPDVAAFIINTRSIVSATDANGGILRGTLHQSAQSAPTLFGRPNNGLKPLADPGIDKGTATLQKAVPTRPGAEPSMPQDGSESGPGRNEDNPTPGEDNEPHTGPLPAGPSNLLGN
jgi:phospholipid/cholesterol/gamma-HCH transport system substrate-binding protein